METMETNDEMEAKDLALAKAGGVSALARLCGVSRQTVQKWERIPVQHLRVVSQSLNIPLEDLLPGE